MPPSLPQAAKLCLATLMAGGIYVLQNAENYAEKLVDTTLPGAETTAQGLTIAADYSGLTELNIAQRVWLEKWILLGTGEEPPEKQVEDAVAEEETPTEEAPQETPAPPAEETLLPPQPEPAQEQEPHPAPAHTELPPDAETDPLPGPGHEGQGPPQPLLDTEPITIATAEPLPWPPVAPQDALAINHNDSICPTPPPAPLVNDVSEPDSAPAIGPQPEPDSAPAPHPGTEQPIADATNADESTAVPTPPVEIPKQAPPVRCKMVLMGDSLMEDLGPRTHHRLNHRKGLQFILAAKYSTGLCRSDFFDWPAHMREVIAEHKPDFLVVFIGANDGQPIKHGDTFVPTGGSQWSEAYGQKMQEIIDIAKAQGTQVIWIGLPVMGKHVRLLAETTRTQKEYCARMGIPYIDSNKIFADDNGKFMAFRKDANGTILRLRRQDKIHLSPEGNYELINKQLIPMLEKNLAEFSATHPERCLTDEEATKTAPAPLIVTIKYKPSTRRESTRKNKRKNK